METCNIDHPLEDVKKKLADQAEFMPSELVKQVDVALSEKTDHEFLNEVFHLLKKYDLADEEEKLSRNEKLIALV
ncbi:hypothetical protein [Fictibacillus barbaricus]|uniref:Group-specific protein n=1 Tax=Fictibacillus barbaricus TaxID=182136 RepID=A0ABU1U165_9BACL|nr:hypothetical protein [Fictibacillus barbaricus]MDR7073219.1 hypothetical protein [Fictibacillus barbaricus]